MKKSVFAVLALSALITTPALADNSGKFYGALDLGAVSYSNATVTVNGTPNTFKNPSMYRIAGGYHFSPMLAAEVAYASFADSVLTGAAGNITLGASSFQVAAVGSYPLTTEFDVIGKLGLAANSAKLTTTGAFAGQGSTGSKTDLLIGAGAQYNVNKQFSIRAQYESFGAIEGSANNPIKAAAFSVGGVYNF